MSLAQERLLRALTRALDGGDVRVYNLTTSQARNQQPLIEKVAKLKGFAGTWILDDWLINYLADEVPESATPAWTATTTETPVYAAAGSLLTLTTEAGDEATFSLGAPELSNAGTVVEARIKLTSSGTTVDTGVKISIFDGTNHFRLWMRAASLNIDGEDSIDCDLSTNHRVKFWAAEDGCAVWIDGKLRQSGTLVATSALQKVEFGAKEAAVSVWDFVRAKVGN